MPPFWGKKTETAGTASGYDGLIERATNIYVDGYRIQEKRAQARALAEAALKLKADCHEAYVLLGLLKMEEGDHSAMQEYFLKALDIACDPYDEYTWDWVITCLDDNLKDYPRLAIYLSKFYDRRPEEYVARYLTDTYLRMNQEASALMFLNRHLGAHPDSKLRKMKEKLEKRVHGG